jgi:hypothetical protein
VNYDLSKCQVTLESFCDKDSSYYNIDLPFRCGDWIYATDGHICVRVPWREYSGTLSDGRIPDTSILKWSSEVEWGPVPEPQPCETCHDRRVVPLEVSTKDFYASPEVDANILVPCDECRVIVGSHRLKWSYVEPLTRFATNLECGAPNDPGAPVRFRFDGGEALVMPIIGE